MKFATKPIRYYPPHLRHVATLHYLGKLKIQLFCRCGRKRKQIAFLVDSSFVIHQSPVGLHDIVNVVTNTAVEVFKYYLNSSSFLSI